jgi:preprotein translocase subunit SecE
MIDILYVLLVVAFFAVSVWMINALEKLKEQ